MAGIKGRLRSVGSLRASDLRTQTRMLRTAGRELLGLLLIGFALLAMLALWSYSEAGTHGAGSETAGGVVGATTAALLLRFFGSLGGPLVVAGVFLSGGFLLVRRSLRFSARFWCSALLLLFALIALPELVGPRAGLPALSGGALGALLASGERALFSTSGALLLNALVLLVAGFGLFGVAPGAALSALARAAKHTGRAVLRAFASFFAALASGVRRFFGADIPRFYAWLQRGAARVFAVRLFRRRHADTQIAAPAALPPGAARPSQQPAGPGQEAPTAQAGDAPAKKGGLLPRAFRKGAQGQEAAAGRAAPDIVEHKPKKPDAPAQDTFVFSENTALGPYLTPDAASVFQAPKGSGRDYDRDSLIMNSRILEKKLADFNVQGKVVTVHPGPVITMYEFEPAPGIKVNKITNLTDDLALALRALSIRIVAPIPGKSVVGIEVPNSEREVVYILDLLQAQSFRSSKSKLTMALGKDIFGNPVEADLSAMPHLLVAGATGTGKSVFLNSLLCSILCRATPDEVKLLLVDPKLLELSIYEGIPHLIADVVTNPKLASAALQGIVRKMEERYQRMAALGVRNISQFNRRVEEALADGESTYFLRPKPGEEQGEEVRYEHMPYIVVVIDELADLMIVSARDVEESLQRLAQMARAAGIHLVLATQRPSVDVLTGIIKANFPSRISFQVSSRTDSRTILDQGGAEALLGMGDMLFLAPGTSKLERLHGSFVTEREVAALVRHLRSQGRPQFDDDLVRLHESDEEAPLLPDEEMDEHYDAAVHIVAESRNASISYIQRRLKIGYNRAARMIERMEREGIVGPQIGAKGREVLVHAHDGGDVE